MSSFFREKIYLMRINTDFFLGFFICLLTIAPRVHGMIEKISPDAWMVWKTSKTYTISYGNYDTLNRLGLSKHNGFPLKGIITIPELEEVVRGRRSSRWETDDIYSNKDYTMFVRVKRIWWSAENPTKALKTALAIIVPARVPAKNLLTFDELLDINFIYNLLTE